MSSTDTENYRDQNRRRIVADLNGEEAAFVEFFETADEIDIINLQTNPEFRRLGAMRMLLQSLLDNSKSLFLEVHMSNHPAISLYLSLGFKLLGIRRGYYRDGGHALRFSLGRIDA